MINTEIRLAYIGSSKLQRKILEEQCLREGNIKFVHNGKDLKTGFKELVGKKPQVIFIDTTTQIGYYNDFNPNFRKIYQEKQLKDTKIVIRTELSQTHPFVKEAHENGAFIIDERVNIEKLVQKINEIAKDKELIPYMVYESRNHALDSYRTNNYREKIPGRDYRSFRELQFSRGKER